MRSGLHGRVQPHQTDVTYLICLHRLLHVGQMRLQALNQDSRGIDLRALALLPTKRNRLIDYPFSSNNTVDTPLLSHKEQQILLRGMITVCYESQIHETATFLTSWQFLSLSRNVPNITKPQVFITMSTTAGHLSQSWLRSAPSNYFLKDPF